MSNKIFYTLEVSYRAKTEFKLFRITNLTADTLKQVRETMFTGGLYRKIDPDTGEIISPWNILEVMIYKQEFFFNAEQSEKKLVYSPKK